MMENIAYKKNFEETIERLTTLYNQQAEDMIFVVFNPPSNSIKRFAKHYANEYVTYPDPFERIKFWRRYLIEKIEIEDDSIPSAYLSEFDQGLYGAIIGGKINFLADPDSGWISSMIKPFFNEITEFTSIPLSADTEWYSRYLTQLKIYIEHSENKFGISHFILIDSLNFVFELVGATKTYLSLFEYPEKVKEAIDFAYELNVKIHNDFFSLIPTYKGGTFSNFAHWLPGRVISESLDPFHLTSVDYFEEWGREPVEKIISQYDGGVIHIHSNGRHLLNAVVLLFAINGCNFAKTKSDANGIYAEHLRCEYHETPMGIMEVKPRLSWWLSHKDSNQRGQKQKAYRILVASSQALLDKNKGDLWDTRKVKSDEQLHIVYAGKPLQSRMKCYWKVCIWDNHGNKTWSKPAFWSMGLLNSWDWKAKWIARRTQEDWEKQDKARLEAEAEAKPDFVGGDQWSWYQAHKDHCDAAPLFRREFKVKSDIKQAIAYVTGLGYYQFYINGKKVGDHVLDPGWTDYTKRVLYEVYDVTDQLRSGDNAVGMMVGRGFYHQLHSGYGFRNCHWTGQSKALLQLEIETADGERKVITTDSDWKVIGGPIIYDAPRLGEIQDSRLAHHGWNTPAYDDKDWEKVNIAPAPKGKLSRQMLEPIRVREVLKSKKMTEPKPGTYVYDLGQNIAGWPRITVDGREQAGHRITVRVNSGLNNDGTVSKRNFSYYTQEYNFILEGKANEIFEPCFRFAGLRYIEIQNFPYKAKGE